MDFRSVCSYGSTALRAVGVSGQCSNQLSYPPQFLDSMSEMASTGI